MALFVLFLAFAALQAGANELSEFPQWDPIRWVVPNEGESVQLACSHPNYYPFNDISQIESDKIRWILPEHVAYIQLGPEKVLEGWAVGTKEQLYKMTITNADFNKAGNANGMYLCAALAMLPNQTGLYAWYYLRWGVGLYSSVPAMRSGGIERYSMNFIVASVATGVFLILAALFSLTSHFRYKGEIPEDSEVDGSEEDKSDIFKDDDSSQVKNPVV